MKTVWRVFAYLKRYPVLGISMLACAITSTLMMVVPPLIIRKGINEVIVGHHPEYLLWLVLIAAVAWALYQWGLPFVESLLPFDTSKVVSVLVLVLICLLVPPLLTWLLLPLFLFFQIRKLFELLAQIEENLRPEVPEPTPEHDDDAEPELSVLTRQSLDDYLASLNMVAARAIPWATERNKKQAGIDWHLTTENARIKLKKLYPNIKT